MNAFRLRALEQTLLAHMQLYGYTLIDIPIVQPADVFLTRAGDVMVERLFLFDHQDQRLALRPEFTAAAAHHYLQTAQGQTVRWQFCGPTFTDDVTHVRTQQHGLGAELIGPAQQAESEIISMAAHGLAKIIPAQEWHIVVGHVGLQWHLLSRFGLDRHMIRWLLSHRETLRRDGPDALHTAFMAAFAHTQDDTFAQEETPGSTQRMLDVLLDSTQYGTTMGGRTREDIARRMLEKRRRAAQRPQVQAAIVFLAAWIQASGPIETVWPQLEAWVGEDNAGRALLQSWRETLDQLSASGLSSEQIILRPNLARNWEYYTGLVFVLETADGTALAGGGRYDELARLLGGSATPAVGFAYYGDALLAHSAIPNPTRPTVIVSGPRTAQMVSLFRSLEIGAVADDTTSTQESYRLDDTTYTSGDEVMQVIVTKLKTLQKALNPHE